MKCKACGNETGEETTKITMVFSISHPENIDIKVDNKYKKLSIEMCLRNKQQLHQLLNFSQLNKKK